MSDDREDGPLFGVDAAPDSDRLKGVRVSEPLAREVLERAYRARPFVPHTWYVSPQEYELLKELVGER